MGSFDEERLIAAYNQNAEHFRSLNSLMWQIPLIAMTLTGGLWFGVSKVESNKLFQLCLLFLAAAGNVGLLIALTRLRYVMGRYLSWSEETFPAGHVSAAGDGKWWNGSRVVQRSFRWLLILAAAISALLLVVTLVEMLSKSPRISAAAYYDRHAVELADAYETVAFEAAHPDLVPLLVSGPPRRVLDIGAGSGRDAAWIAAHGHTVAAVEPSAKMRAIGQKLHPGAAVEWRNDALPLLARLGGEQYDLILLSAVWMHIHPRDRAAALQRLSTLVAPGGSIYLTLRLGPADPSRSIHGVSLAELQALAKPLKIAVHLLGESPDLLSRKGIRWQRVMLTPGASAD